MAAFFHNDDAVLRREADTMLKERQVLGLEGLVGGLEAVVIMVEPENQSRAVRELLATTGLELAAGFRDGPLAVAVLGREGCADFLVMSRRRAENPFAVANAAPRAMSMPNTRLETFVFSVADIERYEAVQKGRGVEFMGPVRKTGAYSFVQTKPSPYTGNSVGVIQFAGGRRWDHSGVEPLDWGLAKPDRPYLADVFELDHTAARVRAEHRDRAIIEFMGLTNHDFSFAIYVESLNSITNVARHPQGGYAQVFTSGITPFVNLETSGPTEKFIHNYGTRVHHMAFRTENIERVCASLAADGLGYLADLVGGPDEGLKQAFSEPMPSTMLINEYIHRYGDFDGFFTRSNVTFLTEATSRQ